MSHADEREYSRVEAAVVVCEYINAHAHRPDWSFTIRDVMRLTGLRYRNAAQLLCDLDRVLQTYVKEGGRGRTLRRGVLRG